MAVVKTLNQTIQRFTGRKIVLAWADRIGGPLKPSVEREGQHYGKERGLE